MTRGTSPNQRRGVGWRRRFAVAVAIAGLLLVSVAMHTSGVEEGAVASDPFTAELQAIVDRLPAVAGDDDIAQLRSLLGSPDAFTIAFEAADDGTASRREQWFYYDLSTMFEFVDGDLSWDLPLDAEVDVLVHADRYDPAAFLPDSTWESLAPVVGDPETFEAVELDPEYEVTATIYVGDFLLLAFDEGGLLFYVESSPLTPEGSV